MRTVRLSVVASSISWKTLRELADFQARRGWAISVYLGLPRQFFQAPVVNEGQLVRVNHQRVTDRHRAGLP